MEQITNSQNKASSSSSKGNIKKMFGGLLFGTLLLASCSDGKKDLPTTEPSINEIEEVKPESIPEPRDIQETWEYKIYKLGLGSIVPIKGDIQKAKVKIANNSELAQLLTGKDVEFETIMPSIIKESMMNRDARSNSGAVGYFQLKPIAVKDVVDAYNLKDVNLDANNPVDNVILGSLYRKRSMELLNQGLGKNVSDTDLEKMMILSYNVGPARTKTLFRESGASNYQEFQKYLARKIGVRNAPEKKTDGTYGVDYMDPLTGLNLNNLATKESKKIAEGLRYVAIIDGISGYMKANETIQILGKITCDENTTLFSAVKKLREQGLFKTNASVNEICKIILETNGFKDTETPKNADLIIVKEPLEEYLNE